MTTTPRPRAKLTPLHLELIRELARHAFETGMLSDSGGVQAAHDCEAFADGRECARPRPCKVAGGDA